MNDATRAPKINPNNLIKSASLFNLQYVSKEKPQSKIMPVSNINEDLLVHCFQLEILQKTLLQ